MAETRSGTGKFKLLRFARIIALVVVAIVVGASAYMRVEQFLFRRRVDQLLTDVLALDLRNDRPQDVARVFQKWGFSQVSLSPQEKCNAGNCDYALEQWSPESRIFRFLDWKPIVGQILILLGGRPVIVRSRIGVRHGSASLKNFSLWILTPGPDAQGLIIGEAGTPWPDSSMESNWDRPAKVLADNLRHGDYLVGTRVAIFNADTGGVPRAPLIWFEFSPDSNTEMVSRLMRFNLRCITRLRACRERDLMPTVWSQIMEDEKRPPANLTCTTDLVKRVARVADTIAVVRIDSPQLAPPPYGTGPFRLSGENIVRLVKGPDRLRRELAWIEVDNGENAVTVDGGTKLQAGEQYIFLLQNHAYGTTALYPCGVLQLTQFNLAMAQEAAAESTDKNW
jgi:hypothetical protein